MSDIPAVLLCLAKYIVHEMLPLAGRVRICRLVQQCQQQEHLMEGLPIGSGKKRKTITYRKCVVPKQRKLKRTMHCAMFKSSAKRYFKLSVNY